MLDIAVFIVVIDTYIVYVILLCCNKVCSMAEYNTAQASYFLCLPSFVHSTDPLGDIS